MERYIIQGSRRRWLVYLEIISQFCTVVYCRIRDPQLLSPVTFWLVSRFVNSWKGWWFWNLRVKVGLVCNWNVEECCKWLPLSLQGKHTKHREDVRYPLGLANGTEDIAEVSYWNLVQHCITHSSHFSFKIAGLTTLEGLRN